MTKEPIMIDENICDYYSDTKEDEEGAYPVVGWCFDNNCKCEDIPFDECVVKAVQYCKLKDKQLKRKEEKCYQLKAENDELKTEFDNFEEQIKLQGNFIDSFLNATNNSEWLNKSILEDEADAIIEKVESDYVQLKKFKQALEEIKEIVQNKLSLVCKDCLLKQCKTCEAKQILQKCEVIDEQN